MRFRVVLVLTIAIYTLIIGATFAAFPCIPIDFRSLALEITLGFGALIFFEVFLFLLGQRTKEKKEREDLLREHSKFLVDEVLKRWFEQPARIAAIMGGGKDYWMTLATAYYASHRKSSITEPKEPDVKYVDQAIKHLTEGYADDWAIWTEAKKMTEVHLRKVVNLWEGIEDRVLKLISTSCPSLMEWNGRGERPASCYILDETVWALYQEVQHCIKTGKSLGMFDIHQEGGRIQAGEVTLYATSPDEAVLNRFIALAHGIIRDPNIVQQTMSINKENLMVEAKVDRFRYVLDKIIDDFKHGYINLKGTCWRCRQLMKKTC